MENIYDGYYSKQVGNGITSYSGLRYQRGNGLFGKILKFLKPALNYIGRQGLMATSNMVSGLTNGESFSSVAKKEFVNRGKSIMNDGFNKLDSIKQKGSGRKKAKKTTKKVVKKTVAKKSSKKVPKSLYKRANKDLFF